MYLLLSLHRPPAGAAHSNPAEVPLEKATPPSMHGLHSNKLKPVPADVLTFLKEKFLLHLQALIRSIEESAVLAI